MVDVRNGYLRLPRIAGDGLVVPVVFRGEIVGMGRDKRKERTAGRVAQAVVNNMLCKILSGVFALIHRTSVSCRVSEYQERILKGQICQWRILGWRRRVKLATGGG